MDLMDIARAHHHLASQCATNSKLGEAHIKTANERELEFAITEMRGWLADLDWLDDIAFDNEDVDMLKDDEIVAAIKQHYDGGMTQFMLDMGHPNLIK